MKTPVTYGDDKGTLRLQLGQALIALSELEAEIVGGMRQRVLLDIIDNQLQNINDITSGAPF